MNDAQPPVGDDPEAAKGQESPDLRNPSENATPKSMGLSRKNPKARLNPIATGVFGVLIGALAVGIPWIVTSNSASSNSADKELLAAAYEACGAAQGLELRDDNSTLIFDNKGDEDSSGADVTDIVCVLQALDVPSIVTSHMGQTTSMDGRQVERWGNYEIQWSYHPSRGMDGTLTVIKDG